MKKTIIIIASIILALILAISGVIFIPRFIEAAHVGTFTLSDYSHFMEGFESERVLGATDTAKDARQKAEKVFVEIYGKSVKEEKPFLVAFDEESQVWLVSGNWPPKGSKGGAAKILIQKSDGKVLAVWHEK
ncbi:MAG: YbbC/YhhH family protein [Oscillospiraceae bacterium]|jgi:hypothetical protein|nr:YbbC/YhhH family protein [Oscillospiraceae bacterium]